MHSIRRIGAPSLKLWGAGIGVIASALLTASLAAQSDARWKALEEQIDRIYANNEYALPSSSADKVRPADPTSSVTTPRPARAAF